MRSESGSDEAEHGAAGLDLQAPGAGDRIARLVAEVGAVRAQRDALRQAVTDRSQKIRELEAALSRALRDGESAAQALEPARSAMEKALEEIEELRKTRTTLESRLSALEAEVVERRREADRKIRERSELLSQIEAFDGERALLTSDVERLRRELDTTRPRLAALQASLAQAARNAEQHAQDRSALRSRIAELEQSLLELAEERPREAGDSDDEPKRHDADTATQPTVAELRAAVVRMRERADSLESRLAERDDRAERLSEQVEGLRSRVCELQASLAERDEESRCLVDELEELRARSAKGADDLKQIRGIGPKYERALHELGVRTYQQIADWDEEQIDRVAQALKMRPGRIVRDDWVGRARELVTGRDGSSG